MPELLIGEILARLARGEKLDPVEIERLRLEGNRLQGKTDPAGALYPKAWTFWHDQAVVTVGNALSSIHNTSQNYALYVGRATAMADADAFTQEFVLASGTYTFGVLGLHDTANGKIDWYLDGTVIVSGQDWYAGTTFNIEKTASVTVGTSGQHTLKGVTNGKNGSSGGYNLYFTKYWFR